MSAVQNVIRAFQNKYPRLTVTTVIDYNSEYYLVEAINGSDEMDPWYGVSKRNGSVVRFIPAANFPEFTRAKNTRTIYEMR